MSRIFTLVIVLALAGSVAGCGEDEPEPGALAADRAALAEVVENPEYGTQVEVAGEVVRSEEGAIVVEAEGSRLLVVPQSLSEGPFEEGSVVMAQGTVERVPGDEPPNPSNVGETQLFDEFAGQPSLAADEVTVVEE